MSEPSHSYTVLRIKRKATEPPLSSLVIQNDPGPAKKKREIKGRGVFRLAETVPDTWKGVGQEEITLKERIKGLMSTTESAQEIPRDAPEEPPLPPETAPTPSQKRMQYRVVPPPSYRNNWQSLPPRVMTYAEETSGKPLTFVDAEAVASAGPSRKASLPSAQEEKEMAPFLSMLEDVLKFETTSKAEEEQYVYDLYYKDIGSAPLPLGAGDGVGALLGYEADNLSDLSDLSEPEDEADEDSNDEDYYRNDYPEDEDADEDMNGYKDAFDSEDEEAERSGDEPGLWDYR